MNCFLQCPRKFEQLYVLKNKPTNPPTWQMQRGLEFHDFANHFFEHIKIIDGGLFIDDIWLEAYKSKCIHQTLPYIDNFISFELDRWEICKGLLPSNPTHLYTPLLREAKIVSDKLERITIIDRLDMRPDGNYTLVEYKTEKFPVKDWKRTELRREMCFERSVPEQSPEFTKSFKGDIVDFVVYFPVTNDVMVEKFNWRSINAMEKAVENIRTHVANKYYPCEVCFHCQYCDISKDCPMTFEGKLRI
jgi:hypothetical protein